MAAKQSKDKPPSWRLQTVEIPENASTRQILDTLYHNRMGEYQRLIRKIEVLPELGKGATLFAAVHPQALIFHDWHVRNRPFLRDKATVEGDDRKPCIPRDPILAKRRQQNMSRMRLQIIDVLEWIRSPLSEISDILAGRLPWEDIPCLELDSDSDTTLVNKEPEFKFDHEPESELQQHLDDLVRFNKILFLWTQVVGDQGPPEEGDCAVVESSREVKLDEGLEANGRTKPSASAVVEDGRDGKPKERLGKKDLAEMERNLDRDLETKAQCNNLFAYILGVVRKRVSKKRPTRSAHANAR